MTRESELSWLKWVLAGVGMLILSGLLIMQWQSSQITNKSEYRFNLALIQPDIGVTFVSFDPVEKNVFVMPFPHNLAITSRSKGEYSIASLYQLGAYDGEGGKFARQKIQGFMRVPVPGYIVSSISDSNNQRLIKRSLLEVLVGSSETSLSRLDALFLLQRASQYSWREVSESELVRAAVIEQKEGDNYVYHSNRLQEFVGDRLFDWGIGAGGLTVSIVNASGENGLGSDLADFLSNLGIDVVMVRSANNGNVSDVSEWQVSTEDDAEELSYVFRQLFGFQDAKVEPVPEEFRAKVLIRVGKDAKELF